MRVALLALLAACLLTLACGKYGPPVRAGEQPERAEPAPEEQP